MSDLIDKQVVLDTIHRFFTEEVDKIPTKKTEDGEVIIMCKAQPLFAMNKTLCKRIKALPSASPTQNCVGNALDGIRRQAVIDTLDRMNKALDEDRTVEAYIDLLRECYTAMPSVNPQEPKTDSWSIKDVADTFKKHGLIREQEPKTGHWINIVNKDLHDYKTGNKLCFECSECKSQYTYKSNYCPNCGCRMQESEEV